MQIDFHHAVTYVTARCAGFTHPEADTIAYAAQYVDDSTSSGPIWFDNKAMYLRCSSAHGNLDLRNLNNAENHLVWLPFHFLPGNGGLPADQNPEGSFIKKIICYPNSPVAEEMIQAAITTQGHYHARLRRHLGAPGVRRGAAQGERGGGSPRNR